MTLASAGCSVPQVGIWRQRGVVAVVGSQTDAGERSRARRCVGAVLTANREMRWTSFAANTGAGQPCFTVGPEAEYLAQSEEPRACVLTGHAEYLEHEGVLQRHVLERLIATTHTTVPRTEFGLEQQQIVVGTGGA